MSLLTQIPAIPTTHAGVPLPPEQLAAAILYMAALHGPTTVRAQWVTDKSKQTRAAHKGHKIVSTSTAIVTLGLEYKNKPENIGKETGPLRGKNDEWLLYPFIIVAQTGLKARLYPVRETIKTTFTVDGIPAVDGKTTIDGQEIKVRDMLYSRKNSDLDVLTIDVFVDNLTLL